MNESFIKACRDGDLAKFADLVDRADVNYVSESGQSHTYHTLSFLSFFNEQALRKFSEAARCKYLTNDDNKVTICHFEFIISEFEKKRQ